MQSGNRQKIAFIVVKNIVQIQSSNWWRQFKVIVLADKLALVSLQALQETWEPDEWLHCRHLIPEFICVASMPGDSSLLAHYI